MLFWACRVPQKGPSGTPAERQSGARILLSALSSCRRGRVRRDRAQTHRKLKAANAAHSVPTAQARPPAGVPPAARRSRGGARFTKESGIPTIAEGMRSRPNKQPESRHANGCEERIHAAPLLRKPCQSAGGPTAYALLVERADADGDREAVYELGLVLPERDKAPRRVTMSKRQDPRSRAPRRRAIVCDEALPRVL
jgi:hypothetical protein